MAYSWIVRRSGPARSDDGRNLLVIQLSSAGELDYSNLDDEVRKS